VVKEEGEKRSNEKRVAENLGAVFSYLDSRNDDKDHLYGKNDVLFCTTSGETPASKRLNREDERA